MKVCCIGDIHGTDKFLKCYEDILKNDNDCEKIIVFGDHFDPYEDFTLDEMIEKYNKFIEISHQDDRIISLLGNHDLSYYIIQNDQTNRTAWRGANRITECIESNLENSYICYKIGDYLFSHAGVSAEWLERIDKFGTKKWSEDVLNNKKGWTPYELLQTVAWNDMDYSGYGNHPWQGCTWIRPYALIECAIDGYNQVVAHSRVDEIKKILMDNGKDLWLIDTKGEPNYLTLEIEI